MKLSQLKTHYSPEQAHCILSLLDQLRDTLWNTCGPGIVEHYQQQQTQHPRWTARQITQHWLTGKTISFPSNGSLRGQ